MSSRDPLKGRFLTTISRASVGIKGGTIGEPRVMLEAAVATWSIAEWLGYEVYT
jgi:hypothetical protein